MSDQDRFGPDDALERELAELGPVMRRQEQVEGEQPDPAFVQALRTRLVGEPQLTPAPPISIRRERQERRWHRFVFGGALSAAAAAAAVIALVVGSHKAEGPGNHRVAFTLPTPNPTNLAQTFPVYGLGGGGGLPAPWTDTAGIPAGLPYAGRLALRAGTLPANGGPLPAHRLSGPAFAAPRIRTLAAALRIGRPIKRSNQPSGRWTYVWKEPRMPSDTVDKSLAVNLLTGQLIYHNLDTAYTSPGPRLTLNAPGNVAVARAWLTRLGWPGSAMPVHRATSPQELVRQDTVTLGWAGAGPTDVPAATLLITRGTVTDADLWPPVSSSGTVAARGYAAAWTAVRAGRVPVGLAGQIYPPRNGSGVLQRTTVLQVFTRTPAGALYLAPAYRFEGTATISGHGSYRWYAFVPAQK
jgi:hypothetical protein